MAVKLAFVAPLVRSVLAVLQANLPAKIAIFNAEAANTIDLALPLVYAFGADEPLGQAGFPVVEVSAVEGTTGTFDIDRGEFDHDQLVNVVVWHEADAGAFSATYEMSLGMARCVIETLTPKGAVPDADIGNQAGVRWVIAPQAFSTDENGRVKLWRIPVLVQFRFETVERFVLA